MSLPGKPGCFWLHSVYDWIVLNNQELIVHAPLQQDAYVAHRARLHPPRIPIEAVHQLTTAQEASLLQASGKHLARAKPNQRRLAVESS